MLQVGPIKEKRVRDVSKLTQNTNNYQNEEEKVPEDHVTHWQAHETSELRAIAMEWQNHERMCKREQPQMALDMFERT